MSLKLLVAAAVSLLFVTSASATDIFDPTTKRCNNRNCGAVQFGGSINGFQHSASPWVIKVYAAAGECLRVEVTAQDTDLEMRIVGPDPRKTWFNDDSGLAPCPLCPLLKLNNVRKDGWYSVNVGEISGVSVNANFTLAYGRYRANNPNCAETEASSRAADKNAASPAPDPEFAPAGR
jgi:hypothetical protein